MGSVKTLLELGLGGFMGSKEALSPEAYSLYKGHKIGLAVINSSLNRDFRES